MRIWFHEKIELTLNGTVITAETPTKSVVVEAEKWSSYSMSCLVACEFCVEEPQFKILTTEIGENEIVEEIRFLKLSSTNEVVYHRSTKWYYKLFACVVVLCLFIALVTLRVYSQPMHVKVDDAYYQFVLAGPVNLIISVYMACKIGLGPAWICCENCTMRRPFS